MILSATLSKPVKNIAEILGEPYVRVKIKYLPTSKGGAENLFLAEFFTETQVFHKKFSERECLEFLQKHEGTTFKACVERTEREEIQILSNKKGKITRNVKKIPGQVESNLQKILKNPKKSDFAQNRRKQYILAEGTPVPFLVMLGIMTAEGKVISSKHDKFRQINRFLELVDDILPETPFSVVDFGSGKSYLTFAIQHYLSEVKKIDCEIFGLDLKKEVIDYCASLSEKLGLGNISFAVGDIASYGEDKRPDLVVTLHACDTATDYALDYCARKRARAILSVPCCQHEINSQLKVSRAQKLPSISLLLKYGLIKERFSALLTDAIRCEILEECGYKVQVLEFIDAENTPKNLLIRAVRKNDAGAGRKTIPLLDELEISQTFYDLRH